MPTVTAEPQDMDDEERLLLRVVERFALVLAASGVPRMPARVFAYALAEDADHYTAGELARGLRVSPAAISGAVRYLVQAGLLDRTREPGARTDVYRLYDEDVWSRIYGGRSEILGRYEQAAAEAAAHLGDRPGGRRMRDSQRFFAFLLREWPVLMERWREQRRDAAP